MSSPAEIRTAFRDGSDFLLNTIESVPNDVWSQPALGEWNVRELSVHACRAWLTTLQYSGETTELTIYSPAEYYVAVSKMGPDVHAQVAERARENAVSVDDPIPTYAAGLSGEVARLVANTSDDQVLSSFAGGIRFIDYLPTRVLELTVHGIDVCDAIGAEAHVPPSAMAASLELLGQISAARLAAAEATDLVRALTGRAPFLSDLNVLD